MNNLLKIIRSVFSFGYLGKCKNLLKISSDSSIFKYKIVDSFWFLYSATRFERIKYYLIGLKVFINHGKTFSDFKKFHISKKKYQTIFRIMVIIPFFTILYLCVIGFYSLFIIIPAVGLGLFSIAYLFAVLYPVIERLNMIEKFFKYIDIEKERIAYNHFIRLSEDDKEGLQDFLGYYRGNFNFKDFVVINFNFVKDNENTIWFAGHNKSLEDWKFSLGLGSEHIFSNLETFIIFNDTFMSEFEEITDYIVKFFPQQFEKHKDSDLGIRFKKIFDEAEKFIEAKKINQYCVIDPKNRITLFLGTKNECELWMENTSLDYTYRLFIIPVTGFDKNLNFQEFLFEISFVLKDTLKDNDALLEFFENMLDFFNKASNLSYEIAHPYDQYTRENEEDEEW